MQYSTTAIGLRDWMASATFKAHSPVRLAGKKCVHLDLSAAKFDLGAAGHFERLPHFTHRIDELLEAQRADFGYGGYGEDRSVYRTDDFASPGETGKRFRTVHLGLDIWGPGGTDVYAPLDGTVLSAFLDATLGGYGPAIILQHALPTGEPFYTLFGHLDPASIEFSAVPRTGQHSNPATTRVRKGEKIATFGQYSDNGGWPPHLHFQLITDLLGFVDDFPGVAFAEDAAQMLAICPDPTPFFDLS